MILIWYHPRGPGSKNSRPQNGLREAQCVIILKVLAFTRRFFKPIHAKENPLMSPKILVADESPTIHKIVAMAFEKEGIRVEGIGKGDHVFEFMEEFEPNVVLADIHLPGINGYELSRKIKNSKPFAHVRVILLTSDFEDIDKGSLSLSQADDTISKPFKSEEILKKVKSQLETSETQETGTEKETSSKEDVETEDMEEQVSAQDENSEKDKVQGKEESKDETPSPAEMANDEKEDDVIQKEFEDIVSQPADQGEPEEVAVSPSEESGKGTAGPGAEPDSQPIKDLFPQEKSTEKEDGLANAKTKPNAASVSNEPFREANRSARTSTHKLEEIFHTVISSSNESPENSAPPSEPGAKPNLIEETLSLLGRLPIEDEPQAETKASREDDSPKSRDVSLGNRVISEHINEVLKHLPEDARTEGLSETLEKTVRDVLSEVAPDIIRKVIQEEIEQIKKMEEA